MRVSTVILTAMLMSEHRGVYCSARLLPGSPSCSSIWGLTFHRHVADSLPAAHRPFIFLTRGSTLKLFLLHASVRVFVQKDGAWRGRGAVAGRLQCLEPTLVLRRAGREVQLTVLSGGTDSRRVLQAQLALPALSAGNQPGRNMDSVRLVLVPCICGGLDFVRLADQTEEMLSTEPPQHPSSLHPTSCSTEVKKYL